VHEHVTHKIQRIYKDEKKYNISQVRNTKIMDYNHTKIIVDMLTWMKNVFTLKKNSASESMNSNLNTKGKGQICPRVRSRFS